MRLALILSAIGFGCAAFAQSVPKSDSTPVMWFQRGTTNVFTVNGETFGGADRIFVTGDGVFGSVVTRADKPVVTLESTKGGLTGAAAPVDGKTLDVR